MTRLPKLILLVTLLSAMQTAGPAIARTAQGDPATEPTLTWKRLGFIARDGGTLSCPTTSFCSMSASWTYVRRNPLGGRSFARVSFPESRHVSDVACATGTLCVGRRSGARSFLDDDVYASRTPWKGGSYRRVATFKGATFELICSGPSFCAGIGGSGTMFSKAPARPGTWRRRGRAADLQHLGCAPDGAACVAYANDGSDELATIVAPLKRTSRWRTFKPAARDPRDDYLEGSCIGSACLVGTSTGGVLSSADVALGSPSWVRTVAYSPALGDGIVNNPACVSKSLCFAVGANWHKGRLLREDLLYSRNAFAGPEATWRATQLPLEAGHIAFDLRCPTAERCFFTDAAPSREGVSGRRRLRTVAIAW